MKSGISTIFFGLFVSIAPAQVNSPSAGGSSALAALVRQPEARVIWSKEVGRLESSQAHAIVTALMVEDSTQRSKRIRGVRFDFSWPAGKGTIYIDEGLLQAQKKIFDQLSLDMGRGNLPGGSHWGFIGSCEFRNNPDIYPLVADFNYSGPESPALRVFGPKGEQIMFPGLMPSQLSKVLGGAIDELKEH